MSQQGTLLAKEELQSNELWDSIIDYVEKKKNGLKNIAKQYQVFSTYDQSDYIQTAYICALQAFEISSKKKIPVDSVFYTLIKNHFGKMQTRKSKKDVFGDIYPKSPVKTVEAKVLDYLPHQNHYQESFELMIDSERAEINEMFATLFQSCLRLMSVNARVFWSYLLDFNVSIREISEKFNIPKSTVEWNLKQGQKAVHEFFDENNISYKTNYTTEEANNIKKMVDEYVDSKYKRLGTFSYTN